MTTGQIAYSKNGESLGEAFIVSDIDKDSILFPAVLMKNSSVVLNFGEVPFQFPVPVGCSTLVSGGDEEVVSGLSDDLHFQSSTEKHKPMALILLPAKDLAEQVHNSIESFTQYVTSPSVQSVLLIGGGNDKLSKVQICKCYLVYI
jgi:ATP-dependent RNA helicase DDX1